MTLRLAGIRPLVGIELHHSFGGEDPTLSARCETCDRCGHQILARYIYFDGAQFLCVSCRAQAGGGNPFPKARVLKQS